MTDFSKSISSLAIEIERDWYGSFAGRQMAEKLPAIINIRVGFMNGKDALEFEKIVRGLLESE